MFSAFFLNFVKGQRFHAGGKLHSRKIQPRHQVQSQSHKSRSPSRNYWLLLTKLKYMIGENARCPIISWSWTCLDGQMILFYMYVQCMAPWLTMFIDVVRMRLKTSGYHTAHVSLVRSSASRQLKSVLVTNVRWMRRHARDQLITQKSWDVTENAAANSVTTFSTIQLTINCVINIKTETSLESLIIVSTVNKSLDV